MEHLEPPHHRRKKLFLPVVIGGVALLVLVWAVRHSASLKNFATPASPPVIVTSGVVQANDVFALMLAKHKLDRTVIAHIEHSFGAVYHIPSIQPGDRYEIITSTDRVFEKFIYRTSPILSYTVSRSSADDYTATTDVAPTEWKEKRVRVKVTKFIEADLHSAGYDPVLIDNLTYELGESIFGWRIDFFTEQRKGDVLDVLMEQEYVVGQKEPLKGGKFMRVLIASYKGSGTKVDENIAIRYTPPGSKRAEYYDPDGGAMRRAFLRAPFTKGAFRVSSNFNLHRFHPILRIYRPHHGTDYAAAIGTPVASIGNGVVVRAGWASGYGNCVDVRHTIHYTSRYGHLSRVAVHRGQSVAQGQYIGNVGNTGLSTGPHLHFEMLVDGKQRNFLAMSFPAASSLSKQEMVSFVQVRDALMQRLKNLSSQASAKPTASDTKS
jgi:murein DD-endopeptidase MepM/ murein hydrolase activator NlpD